MIFDNRIEIVNPGCIAGGYSIEEVKLGNSFARNPLIANFCAKTMPYRGLGSGLPRVLSEKCHVEFIDNKEGNQFIVRINRPLTAYSTVSNDIQAVSKEERAVSKQAKEVSKEQQLLAFCSAPKSLSEICSYLGLKDRYKAKKKYINPLLNQKLRMTEPDSPNSPTQKYVTIKI